MPLVYPDLSASQLNDFLKQSSWVKFKSNVEVFDEAGMGRGVRVLKAISKTISCAGTLKRSLIPNS